MDHSWICHSMSSFNNTAKCCRQSRAEQQAESLPATLNSPEVQIISLQSFPLCSFWKSQHPAPEPWHPPLPGLLSKGISFQGKAQANDSLSLSLNTLLFNFITLLGLAVLYGKSMWVFPPLGNASPNVCDILWGGLCHLEPHTL